MNKLNYAKVYKIQDKVLDTVFSLEHDFYLTGGTCLSRYYWEKRYSDDLDFFANSSSLFGINTRKITDSLKTEFTVKEEVESKDFARLIVNNLLQVDFVNDRVPHYKDVVVLKSGYRIDMERMGLSDYNRFRIEALHNTGVSFCTRLHFGMHLGDEDRYYIRLAYSGINTDEIEEGLTNFKQFLEGRQSVFSSFIPQEHARFVCFPYKQNGKRKNIKYIQDNFIRTM